MRRKLGWAPECQLVIEAGEGKVVIHRLKTVEELSGIFHDAVRGRKPLSHEEETRIMEQAVAEQVAAE
jgi:bifunctional DNA-binding transcriptional regulator/antitoxin component of YhaV-PrlF toxin-antitoxin module